MVEAENLAAGIGYPILVRASFALGGTGAAWVHHPDDLAEAVRAAIAESPIHQAWLEESVFGWKEYELEVMRDSAGNFVVVCSIENIDPMGIHTGDSITVAPAQTLTDREYQVLRDLARRVMDAVGVETGGSNVQFAVDPNTGRVLVIEMNPRVSRSSALASKATGFPIAKLAALVAVGYTLAEITNDITRQTKAAFEPSLDYVVVKIPRWAFEKFPGVDATLGPQMKSVGEVMALGRTFPEALMKAVQSLEIGIDALDGSGPARSVPARLKMLDELRVPTADRLFRVYRAVRQGVPLEQIASLSGYDLWFLAQMQEIAELEKALRTWKTEDNHWNPANDTLHDEFAALLRTAKQYGFADNHIARLLSTPEKQLDGMYIRNLRQHAGILPTFQRVDTCAAEFDAQTPYLYSTYEIDNESASQPTAKRSSSWVEGQTGLVRVLNSITAAARRLMHCPKWGLRRLCTIATRKRYPPIMIPPTGCILSH